MKITAVFLCGEKYKKNIKDNIKNTFSYITKLMYLLLGIFFGVVIITRLPISSGILHFSSNFRQAESEDVKISDLFKLYGIYNNQNYMFTKEEKVEKAEEIDAYKNQIEIIDKQADEKDEQSVFGENKDINVQITENSENIQRISLNKMKILNYSLKREIDFKSLANSRITLTKKSDQILLYNTHTSESYANSENYQFEYSGARRSQDANFNMLSVAKKLKENLDIKGFSVIHDTTPHDYGTYTSSYARSRITVKNALSTMQTPGIIIDVHRDATDNLDYRPIADIKGIQVAQCMLVMGVGTDVTKNPYYEDNLKLALKLQQLADEVYPGLFKPMLIRNSIYNQDLNKYALLIEVGASGNTLDEAYLATRCLSNLLNIIYKD